MKNLFLSLIEFRIETPRRWRVILKYYPPIQPIQVTRSNAAATFLSLPCWMGFTVFPPAQARPTDGKHRRERKSTTAFGGFFCACVHSRELPWKQQLIGWAVLSLQCVNTSSESARCSGLGLICLFFVFFLKGCRGFSYARRCPRRRLHRMSSHRPSLHVRCVGVRCFLCGQAEQGDEGGGGGGGAAWDRSWGGPGGVRVPCPASCHTCRRSERWSEGFCFPTRPFSDHSPTAPLLLFCCCVHTWGWSSASLRVQQDPIQPHVSL